MKFLWIYIFLLFNFLSWNVSANSSSQLKDYPFIMSLSGGVSLGSYQAGYLYYQTQILRKNRDMVRPWIITGSSAGAINALLTVIEYCEEKDRDIDDSLFWKTWKGVGFHELTHSKNSSLSPVSLFSREAFQESVKDIEERWREGLPTSCDIALGVTTTLLSPQNINLSEGINVQRQAMRFILKIKGRGKGLVPLIENYTNLELADYQPQLFLNNDVEKRFSDLIQLLFASSAFPGAFEPVPLRICQHAKSSLCEYSESKEYKFIDGGILENQPLRLAIQIANQSLRKDENNKIELLDQPTIKVGRKSKDVLNNLLVRHVDTDARGYPSLVSNLTDENKERFILHLVNFTSNFVVTSRTKELYSLLEQYPNIRKRISSTVSLFPRASDPWGAFLGFFDKDFRKYDFYLGISEARRSIVIDDFKAVTIKETPIGKEANCIFYFSNPDGVDSDSVPSYCLGAEYENLRMLSQLTWNRLAEGCLDDFKLSPSRGSTNNFKSCKRINLTGQPEWIEKRFSLLPWRRDSNSVEEGLHVFRTLQSYGYNFDKTEFKDEDVPIETQVGEKIRGEIYKLAHRQPMEDQGVIAAFGENLANQISYVPPENYVYFMLGGSADLGVFKKMGILKGLIRNQYIGIGLQTYRFVDIFKSGHGSLTYSPQLNFELDVKQFEKNIYVIKLMLKTGYLFSAKDDWGNRKCFQGAAYGDCSGITVQPGVGVTFLQRIRMQYVQKFVTIKNDKIYNEGLLQLGFQIPF